jgi:ABC-2 type transport system ATP-binding protein
MPVVDLVDVSKSFKLQTVLRNVTVQIESSRCYGLSGPNGSGKSVLLLLLCGLLPPDSGSVTIDPAYLSKDRSFPDWFGISINGPAYLPGLSALQNLTRLASIRKRADEAECATTLESLGLDPASRQHVRSFSLGMKQKLALAQAFIESPKVLLLDEPFNALDSHSVTQVTQLLQSKLAAGATIVMTSHHSSEISALCDTTLNIANHALVQTRS